MLESCPRGQGLLDLLEEHSIASYEKVDGSMCFLAAPRECAQEACLHTLQLWLRGAYIIRDILQLQHHFSTLSTACTVRSSQDIMGLWSDKPIQGTVLVRA